MSKNINTDLVDISNVIVDTNLPKREKIAEYVRQIKNPYHYKCGKYEIIACFSNSGSSIEDCLQGMMA